MVKLHNPSMLVLLKTGMADYKYLTTNLQFKAQIQSPAIGQFGGIVIVWKNDLIKLDNVSTTP